MKQAIKDILVLGKFTISLPVGITAYTGYALYDGALSLSGLIALAGIFFLSASASTVNQIQERKADAKMNRTANRPIPTGRISVTNAIIIALSFWVMGTLLLSFTTLQGLMWGWAGMAWYNLVYTPLKKVSAFSVFPGALVGAIPPVAGWMAAGGALTDPRLHFLALFFFLGQMPHFWLLVIKYGKDYKQGGFPTLFDYFSTKQINRINLVWLIATFVSAIFLPLNHVMDGQIIAAVLITSSILMIGWVLKLHYNHPITNANTQLRQLFIGFNSYYLLVMLLISIDQLNL